ncbi:hypothetical protein CYMTET_54937 [Cymbomonas tetramitiformis]|uniref:NADPH-dependent diflavin oxidoreductase 1 n=1 Tax=Cymbomonas tetramitiformis TaxID=36881 RepID=A0AAE0BFR3_9CHLO|nr:hypothetical protein CYMTET_54937 [Cymbomonas tetramitiformis]
MTAAVTPAPQILVLYGSETGNAQDVAESLGRAAQRRYYQVRVCSTDSYNVENLPLESTVIFVVSTTGQGDPPESFKNFWRFLLRKSLPADSLSNLRYAVFGLGDSGYVKYNIVAKRLAKRLISLGGAELLSLGLGDDQHKSGFEGTLDPWTAKLWKGLRQHFPLPTGLSDPDDDAPVTELSAPKYKVEWVPMTNSTSSGQVGATPEEEAARAGALLDVAGGVLASTSATDSYGPHNPYFASVLTNTRLTDEGHTQDVRHLEVDLGESGLSYAPGDSLAILPQIPEALVQQFLTRLGLDGDALVRLAKDTGGSTEEVRVRHLVRGGLDFASAPPRRYFFEVLSHFTTSEVEQDRLQYFGSAEGRDDVYRYCNRERRSVMEILEDFPSVRLPLEWLLTVTPRLRPRYFSISSSHAMHPKRAHVTAAIVDWQTPYKRRRSGLCTAWLASLDPSVSKARLAVWVARGSLRLPVEPRTPIILVGPGTGVAPFRSFIQERAMLCEIGAPVGPVCLFFGCRKRSGDFLYAAEWEKYVLKGPLHQEGGLFAAFSQDQPEKVYVTHRIRQEGERLWRLLSTGACVYVSGSSGKMPTDVLAAFEDVVSQHAGLAHEDAKHYLQAMMTQRRYQVETWS